MIGKRYTQQSPDYDCASSLDIFLNQSYEIETIFEQIDGDLGAGFIFSSIARENLDFAQLVRFDGNGILLAGYYQDGEFNATNSCKAPIIQPGTKHTLSLRVNLDIERYSVFLDKKEIISSAILRYPSGHIGLQSSGGRMQFHSVTITPLSSKIKSSELQWVRQFVFSSHNEIVVPNEKKGVIQFYDVKGNLQKEIGTSKNSKGQLDKPNAVSFLDDSTLLVTDCGSNKLEMFDFKGRWLNSVGWKGTESGQFNHPNAIGVNNTRQIFIVDRDNNRVQVFNDSLKPLTQFGAERLKEPSDIAIQDSNLYVLNTGYSQIECYTWTGTKAIWKKFISYGGGEGRGLAVSHDTLYVSVVNAVRAYDTVGTLLRSFHGRSANFILPQGIVVGKDNHIYIADFFFGRIIGTTHDLLDPSPQITYPDSASAIIEWESIEEWYGTISYPFIGSCTNSVEHDSSDSEFTHHRVVLHDLRPGTTIPITFHPSLTSIPDRNFGLRAPRYTITPPVSKRSKLYARLPMATIIFTNIVNEQNLSPDLPQQPGISASEIQRIENQIDDGIRFYWMHSGMRFFIDNEFIIINAPLKRNQLYGNEWWYPPKDSMLGYYLKINNREMKKYSAFLYLTCTQQYDTTLNKYVLAGKGGAFTNGVGTGKGYGISWWDVTEDNHNAGNNWLMVHEFNHQLDDIFLHSGYPEYWFNHISPTIGTAAKFGEHFDANAYILRMVPPEEWYDLQFTTLESAHDLDEDGIPDNTPELPMDETRLGSDPTKIDTDGDAVTDLDELRLSNWITEGWGETYGGLAIFPNLHNPDTDNDGIPDNIDSEPCFPNATELHYGSTKEVKLFSRLSDPHINASIYGAWDADSLYFIIKTDTLVPIKLMIDGNGDGWFCGRENYSIVLTPVQDNEINAKVQILNCTNPHRWPFNDSTKTAVHRLRTFVEVHDSSWLTTIHVPKDEASGFSLIKNKPFGISLGFLLPVDQNGHKRYINIFEPNRFCTVRLIQ